MFCLLLYPYLRNEVKFTIEENFLSVFLCCPRFGLVLEKEGYCGGKYHGSKPKTTSTWKFLVYFARVIPKNNHACDGKNLYLSRLCLKFLSAVDAVRNDWRLTKSICVVVQNWHRLKVLKIQFCIGQVNLPSKMCKEIALIISVSLRWIDKMCRTLRNWIFIYLFMNNI